jgi:hypothetical protein
MKNKKKHFEALKSKLKNLYFKKALSIQKKANVFKLLVEKQQNLYDIGRDGKEKTKETVWLKNDSKIPNIKTVGLSKSSSANAVQINKNVIEKIYNNFKNLSIENISKVENKNYKNESISKNSKNYIIQPIVNNNTTQEITNNRQVRMVNRKENKNETINKIDSSTNNFHQLSLTKVEFLEKPEQIKNLKPDQILNTTSYDVKTLYIPSKSELINIKNNIINKKDNRLVTTIVSPQQKVTNKTINNNPIMNSKTVNKSVYVLPAYYDGTDGPVKQDTIARIHKNEVVLSANEAKNLKGEQSGIVKNDVQNNLRLPEKTNFNQNEIKTSNNQQSQQNEKYPVPTNEQNESLIKDVIPNEAINSMRLNSATESTQIDKELISIEKNLGKPVYFSSDYKNKSLPVWRVILG